MENNIKNSIINNSKDDIIKYYKDGANIDTIVYNAIKYGNQDILKWALTQKNIDYYGAAIIAIKYNRYNSFKLLKDYINTTSDIFYIPAINSGEIEIVKFVYKIAKNTLEKEDFNELVDNMAYECGNWGRSLICDWLYKKKGNFVMKSILEGAVNTGRLSIIKWAVNIIGFRDKELLKAIYDEANNKKYYHIVDFLKDEISTSVKK